MDPFSAICLVGLVTLLFWSHYHGLQHSDLPLPPGPKGEWITGVKGLLSPTEPWKLYASWARFYGGGQNGFVTSSRLTAGSFEFVTLGPLLSFRVYNRRIIVLNDATVVHDLLNKRASLYSDRPKSWMFHETCGRGKSVFNISSLNERHKKYRRLLLIGLGPSATQGYWPALHSEAQVLIDNLAENPKELEKHFRRLAFFVKLWLRFENNGHLHPRNAAAVIMKMAYGYTVRENDPFISVAEESAKISGLATRPGRWLVDYYPIGKSQH